jgi:LEA14-like dessication related protein
LVNKIILIGGCIGAAIIAVIIGLIVYSYTSISATLDNVSFAGIDHVSSNNLSSAIMKSISQAVSGNWFQFITNYITGIKFNLYFGLTNHGIFPVYIPKVSYNLSVNGVNIVNGQSKIDETIKPGETKELPVLADIATSGLEPAAISVLSISGIVDLQTSGTVDFNVLGLTISIPFQVTKQINLEDEIKKSFLGSNSPLSEKSNSFTSGLTRTSLSLQTSTYTTIVGHGVTFTGRLDDSDGNGIPNQEIDIKRHLVGSYGSTLTVTRTDSNGDFSVTWSATKPLTSNTASVYSQFKGSSQYLPSKSSIIQIQVLNP